MVAVVHPASKSTALETIGRLRTTDNPGICLPTNKTVGKKFPNKFRNPKPSNINPTNPHLIVTKMIPIKNVIVPLKRSILIHKRSDSNFKQHDKHCYLVNKAKVRSKPIENTKPIRKSAFPMK